VGAASSISDGVLMREIKAGNLRAFDQLYYRYSKRLLSFSLSVVKSREEAENIVQEVFLALWMNRGKIGNDASVKYYIFTIAYNTSISVLRRKAKDEKFFEQLKNLQELSVEPEDLHSGYYDLEGKLSEIINELPARQREIFILHKVNGLKYQEIATKLNISVNTIENHMSRALKTIRSKLGENSISAAILFYLFVS
jgi:RNA polymerase sigma-70 factor (ECF subfamily)